MLEFLFVLLCQAAAGAPTTPDPASPADVQQPAAADAAALPQTPIDARDIVRCRRVPVTGSRLGGRRCTSLRQDAEQRQNAREETEKMINSGLRQICASPPCGGGE